MNYIKGYLVFIISFLIISCGENIEDQFRMDKQYWNDEDYKNALAIIGNLNFSEDPLPNLSDANTVAIFNKIVDKSNIDVVAKDENLGLVHKSKFIENIFDTFRSISDEYSMIDREDKYIYSEEYVAIEKFMLYFQFDYIRLFNEKIISESDNPEKAKDSRVIKSNEQVLVNNYKNYIDEVNYENRFSEAAKESFAQGLNEYFPQLLEKYPKADYSSMKEKAKNMANKTSNSKIKEQLEKIIELIDKNKEAQAELKRKMEGGEK